MGVLAKPAGVTHNCDLIICRGLTPERCTDKKELRLFDVIVNSYTCAFVKK